MIVVLPNNSPRCGLLASLYDTLCQLGRFSPWFSSERQVHRHGQAQADLHLHSKPAVGRWPRPATDQHGESGGRRIPRRHRAHTSFRKGRTVDQPGYAVDRAPSPLVRNASRGLAASSPVANLGWLGKVSQQDRQGAATGTSRFGQRGEDRRRRCGRARHKTVDLQSGSRPLREVRFPRT